MRQPSLYEYFDSKHALYDAMFADGNRQLLERLDAVTFSREPRAALKQWLARVRRLRVRGHRALPSCCSSGPSPASRPRRSRTRWPRRCWAALDTLMRAAGVTEQGDIDCIVAITAGLTDAQISNDPGGNRWLRHLNRLVDLLVDDAIATGSNQ